MLSSVLLALQLRAAARPDSTASTVRGVVRAEASGATIADAHVDVIDVAGCPCGARSDAAGRYQIREVAPGTHRLRFVAYGYDTLAITVVVAGGVPLQLDVALTGVPARLPRMTVTAPWRGPGPTAHAAQPTAVSGAWRATGADLRESAAVDDADLFRLMATNPQAQLLPESPTALHLRGGSGDENRFLLDGAPIFSPVHGGTLASAFDPDIVDAVVVQDGAPSARYGDALSGFVDVQTRPGVAPAFTARGAAGPTALRTTVDVPLFAGRAGLLLSGRGNVGGIDADGAGSSMPGVWWDRFAKLTLRAGANDLTLSSFGSHDALGFPATAVAEPTLDTHVDAPRNGFAWSTTTQALRWRRPIGARAALESHAWIARADVDARWHPDSGALTLASRLRARGLSAIVTVPVRAVDIAVGAEAEQLATRYEIDRSAPGGLGPADSSRTRLVASPATGSTFAEARWVAGSRWTVGAGLRGTVSSLGASYVEPRLDVRFAPTARVAMVAGYARLHQHSQSLRNEESVLASVVRPDLPVAVGTPGVPLAVADDWFVGATVAVDRDTRFTLDGYARRLGGLLLVAPATAEPFATDGFAVGDGSAWGVGASLAHHRGRVSLDGSYALGQVVRHTDAIRYHPSFAPDQLASLALGYQAGGHTRLRSAFWATSGRATTPIGDDVGWDTSDSFSGARELSGTPSHVAGPLDGEHLPLYVRLDLGLRHTIPVRRARDAITLAVSVNNVLARENAAAVVVPGHDEARRPLSMLPPSIVAGLEWHY